MAKQGTATTARRLMSSNVMIMLVSLFIASVIWMISKLDEVEVETISIPVRPTNIPANCEIRIEPTNVEVRVQYQKGYKEKVTPDNILVFLNLFNDDSIADVSDFKASPRTITLQNVKITEAGEFVRAVEIVGDGSVNVKAKKYSELARVEANVNGEPAPEFQVGSVIIDPMHVRLTGPPKVLEELKKNFAGDILVKTEPIDISGARQNVLDIKDLILFPDVKLANPEAGQVKVTVQISEKLTRKSLAGVSVTYRPFENNLSARCEPSSATVQVEAPASILAELQSSDFIVKPKQFIAEEPGAKGTVSVEATFADTVPLPRREKISILGVTPSVVAVEIFRP